MAESKSDLATYHHTQKGPWSLMLYVVAAAFLAAGGVFWHVPAMPIIFFVTGAFMFLLGASIGHLTVSDEVHQLLIRFGPFPLFRKRFWYDDIIDVEKGRITLIDGWGIHWVPRRGWIWNIWGYDCVIIRHRRGTFRVGTDDPDGLVKFLRSRITSS
jgi:hypothetical protein